VLRIRNHRRALARKAVDKFRDLERLLQGCPDIEPKRGAEKTNLVDARPEVLAELRALLEHKKAAARVSPFDP